MSVEEESALEALKHEQEHTYQAKNKNRMGNTAVAIQETVNEWITRRKYSDFITSLGGKALYEKEIIEDGAGYWDYIKNFDAMRDKFGIADAPAFLAVMENIHKTVRRDEYKKALCDVFFKAGKGKIKRRDINKLLQNIDVVHNSFMTLLGNMIPNP